MNPTKLALLFSGFSPLGANALGSGNAWWAMPFLGSVCALALVLNARAMSSGKFLASFSTSQSVLRWLKPLAVLVLVSAPIYLSALWATGFCSRCSPGVNLLFDLTAYAIAIGTFAINTFPLNARVAARENRVHRDIQNEDD